MDLRASNVPVSVIADNCGINARTVRAILNDYYQRNRDWAGLSDLMRKHERERQIEQLDAQTMRLVMLDPRDPAALTAAGVGVRDWLAAVETSRRLKIDLIRLHGLEGSTSLSEPGRAGPAHPADVEGDPVAEARVLRGLVESFRTTNPAAYAGIVAALAGPGAGPRLPEDDLPLPGGGHLAPDPAVPPAPQTQTGGAA